MTIWKWKCRLGVAAAAFAASSALAADVPMPRLSHENGQTMLMVDGQPSLVLGAQVNNSSAWPSILPKVWPAVERIHANTLVIPIAWEQIEAEEGKFDFSVLDAILSGARQHHLRVDLLWFGTWKNNSPSYTPLWVKRDPKRFPRVIGKKGEVLGSLSPHAAATLEADRKAFTALMRHLKETDPAHTVIMVQVENEPGTYGTARDFSPAAEALFRAPVPDALIKGLKKSPGSWREVFGEDADEMFHAWSVARFIGQVAASGKEVYPLPLYVNAALRDPFHPGKAGGYESGGATDNVLDLYKIAAPAIDLLCPDIYMPEHDKVSRVLELYHRPDNPIFVAEIGDSANYARYFFAAFGHGGLGFVPFGIDFTDYTNYPLGAATLDEATLDSFARNYALVAPMLPELARLIAAGKVWGAAEPDNAHSQILDLGRRHARIEYGLPQFGSGQAAPGNPKPAGGVLVAELGPDEYLLTGFSARVSFEGALLRVEEGHFDQGKWVLERIWNGDLTDYGLNLTATPHVLRVRLEGAQ